MDGHGQRTSKATSEPGQASVSIYLTNALPSLLIGLISLSTSVFFSYFNWAHELYCDIEQIFYHTFHSVFLIWHMIFCNKKMLDGNPAIEQREWRDKVSKTGRWSAGLCITECLRAETSASHGTLWNFMSLWLSHDEAFFFLLNLYLTRWKHKSLFQVWHGAHRKKKNKKPEVTNKPCKQNTRGKSLK